MILKYKQDESWAYLEGTYVRWTLINIQDEIEAIFESTTDELTRREKSYEALKENIEEKLQTEVEDISLKTSHPIMSKRTLCAIVIYDKDRGSDNLIVLDDTAFLLNDTGKTIERLL